MSQDQQKDLSPQQMELLLRQKVGEVLAKWIRDNHQILAGWLPMVSLQEHHGTAVNLPDLDPLLLWRLFNHLSKRLEVDVLSVINSELSKATQMLELMMMKVERLESLLSQKSQPPSKER